MEGTGQYFPVVPFIMSCKMVFESVYESVTMLSLLNEICTFLFSSSNSIQFLRHLKEYFGVMFKIQAQQPDGDDGSTKGETKVLLSCVGVGYTNINKTMV